MPIERYYLAEPLILHTTSILKGTEFHHLAHVMRGRIGDSLELVNGQGILAQATVKSLNKNEATLQIDKVVQETRPLSTIILAQALPKINRLDFILEKGTELGVDEFWLFPGQLSLKKDFSVNQKERAHALTIAAMKQSGRLTLPRVKMLPFLYEWPELNKQSFFGDLDPQAPLFLDHWKSVALSSPITFFIGPESGWSDQEINLLKSKGAIGVKLHNNILRTDTASLVAISLIQHQLLKNQLQ